jgi:hypothetical protein
VSVPDPEPQSEPELDHEPEPEPLKGRAKRGKKAAASKAKPKARASAKAKGRGKGEGKGKDKAPVNVAPTASAKRRRSAVDDASDHEEESATVVAAGADAATGEDDHASVSPRAKRRSVAKEVQLVKFVTTGEFPEQLIESIVRLGAIKVTTVDQCTHVLAEKAKRTPKFLSAIGAGKYVVGTKWCEESVRQNTLVCPETYYLKDGPFEKEWKCNLKVSLEKARLSPVFSGMKFHLTRKHEDFEEMIVSNGGVVVKRAPTKEDPNCRVLVVKDDDVAAAKKLPCVAVVKEYVMSGILRQELLKEHEISGASGGGSSRGRGKRG